MGLLDNTTQRLYYDDDSNFGSYQFVSLEDIINQFMVAYVGEEKIISKARRTDVAFHAQRALAELSFDTFKSIKSQEIELPPTLTMKLPHDYVNYTSLSWSDGAGIKHPLYPTKHTSNPFKIQQDDDGRYDFAASSGEIPINNAEFEDPLNQSTQTGYYDDWKFTNAAPPQGSSTVTDVVATDGTVLKFTSNAQSYTPPPTGSPAQVTGRAYAVWQKIDVEGKDFVSITATGTTAASGTYQTAGVLTFGISATPGDAATNIDKPTSGASVNHQLVSTKMISGQNVGPNFLPTYTGGNGYYRWDTQVTNDTQTIQDIDVTMYDEVWVMITSFTTFSDPDPANLVSTASTNQIDTIEVNYEGASEKLIREGNSTTWTNFKATTPSENNNDDYEDNDYWSWHGERYGLEPSHAQVNGSFFIDNLTGLIHFSSNISGKTVLLDYISDSLGTDGEMQVHKFAEDAIYKWIAHAVLSTRANTQEYIVRRYQKDKFAAVRKAKLRLSNIKIEEITQTLRGKSKHIKH
tara:strand:+ start:684 stop:2243 length:1560 start_codon:yes stop_codon:yes gene_type:complete